MNFKVEKSENFSGGRNVVAKVNFKVGDLLFKEKSFASIPMKSVLFSNRYCSWCCKKLINVNSGVSQIDEETGEETTITNPESTLSHQCKYGCTLWFCSEECSNQLVHQLECSFVEPVLVSSLKFDCDHSLALLAIRVLLKKSTESDLFDTTVGHLTSQKESFIQQHRGWYEKYEKFCDHFMEGLKSDSADPIITSIFNKDQILDIICSIAVNAFAGLSEIEFNRLPISNGFFYKAALLNHSCEPNTYFSVDGESIEFRLIKETAIDETIYDTYVDLLQPTINRQKTLLQNKNFLCKCSRCLSPSENGRYFSSIKCKKCDIGYLSPKVTQNAQTLQLEQHWSCQNNCSISEDNQSLDKKLLDIQTLLDKQSFQTLQSLEEYKISVENALNELHQNHYLQLQYHLTMTKFYKIFQDLHKAINHCRKLTKLVEIILDHPSGESVDCYFKLGELCENLVFSLSQKINASKSQGITNEITQLGNDIRSLLKECNDSYKKSLELAVLCYGESNIKTLFISDSYNKSKVNKK
ncbi:hypothetical protein DLAC_00245 [Tieghemostelium lacteum]|uniref:SET domain-containing protein n=1 Tax=Tieghemostelium lacteum TaxID=361077 RepID=A0A152A983_TIELA|nr:hypothetical protein DLAC_00245 [Tieghemostelium lacteum]|eukprot:KYR02783.1 hypothetical protein DLAC_00245 [Tieghemostelium lacteum]